MIEYNEEKFKELVLYIAQKCQNHKKYGKTKLNKILFYSDFIAYAQWHKPITGAEYYHLPKGPAPRPITEIMEEMIKAGELVIIPRQIYDRTQERPTNLRSPNLSLFTPQEISLVDSVIEQLKYKSAEEVSELSHYVMGWRLTEDYETIPYYTVLCQSQSDIKLTKEDLEQGLETAKEFGLLNKS